MVLVQRHVEALHRVLEGEIGYARVRVKGSSSHIVIGDVKGLPCVEFGASLSNTSEVLARFCK